MTALDPARLWMLLNELAGQMGVEVRLESLDYGEEYQVRGGLCRLGGGLVAFVDRSLPVSARILQLGRALNAMELDGVYLRPAVRDFLDEIQSEDS